ncbi:MAG: hypothetical protein IKO80_09265, partial [Lachnospiraceae bacterium]|nr:hypothetical protein [Lachnospiraceae bacterium]
MPIGDLQEEVVKKPFEFKTGETTKSVERENMKIERQLANENLWKEADPRFAEKHKSALRLRLRQNTTRLLFNEDRATINPELELIEAQLANLESLLQRPMTELTEAQAVIDAYSLVIAHMVDYEGGGNGRFPVKKQRRARVSAIRKALEQELGSFAVAFHQFSKNGEIPKYISKAADVVEGRHIHPELTGSAAEKLAQDKHRLISLARDNGDDDGQQMKDVKDAFRGLAAALNTPLSTDPNDLAPQKEVVLAHYEDVIQTCAKYLKDHKNPRRQDGIERKAEVQALHDRLTREKDYISAAADKLIADNPAGYTWTDVYGLAYLTATTAMRRKKPAPASSGSKSRSAGKKSAKRPQAEAAGKEQQIAQELTDVLKQSQEGLAAEKARQEMLFRKRYKPNMEARIRLLRTGIWDPNAKKDQEPAEGAQNGKRWEMWRFDREALARMSGENFFTDEEFRDKVIALNDTVVRNFEWFEDPQNYPLMKERFLEHLRGTMKRTVDAYNEHQKYVSLLSLDYPEVREAVISFYRNNSKLLYVIQEDGAKFETTQDFTPNKYFHSILMPVRALKKRKHKIDKALDLRDRGPEIYKSAAVKYLITSDDIDTPEYKDRMAALQKQIKGNDALIRSLISRKFSELTNTQIYRRLREHLGDKALFADYRTLRDMTEDYLKTIALHDPESARVERDFDVAYTDTIHGPFAAHMRDAAAAVLSSASLRQEWKEAKGGSKQRSAMKKDLYRVKVAVDLLMEATDGVSLTQEGWDYITSYIRDHIAKVLKNEWEFEPGVYEKENRPRYKKLVENAAKKYNKGEVLTRKEWSQGFTDPAPGRELKTSDFSYGEIFKQAGIIDSEILSEVIPDVKLRRFLGDNLGSIIIGNQELVDKLPFMKGIRGLDQLDRLTYGQFELVVSEIVG